MAYFAKLDDGKNVIEIHVVHDNELIDSSGVEREEKGVAFLVSWSGGHSYWKQTFVDGGARKNYAGVGYTYDAARDAFIPPKPSDDATLDEATCQWIVPVIDSIGADSV